MCKRVSSFFAILLFGVPARAAVLFPSGDALNAPLLADPWEFRTGAATLWNTTSDGFDRNTQVELGQRFGLVQGKWGTVKVQAGIGGDIRSRFQFFDSTVGGNGNLVNDYTVSLPIDFREADDSARIEFYHVSSHLGDGFSRSLFLSETRGLTPRRYIKNAMKIQVFYGRKNQQGLRLYWGGEVSDRPEGAIGQHVAQIGGELVRPLSEHWRLILGIDAHWLGEVGWKSSLRGMGGLRCEGENRRFMELYGAYFRGNSVQKQLYQARESYAETGVRFGF